MCGASKLLNIPAFRIRLPKYRIANYAHAVNIMRISFSRRYPEVVAARRAVQMFRLFCAALALEYIRLQLSL